MKTHLSSVETLHDVVVACPAMKNNKNVSMMVRSASCLGVPEIILTGQNRVNNHISRECDIEVTYKNSLLPVIKAHKKDGFRVIAIEQHPMSESIYDFRFPDMPIILTMGGETRGMDQEILNEADHIVEVPLYGNPYSMNVAASLSICMYELAKQWNVNLCA